MHDVGEHAGAPYLVSELLEGETLRARIEAAQTALAGERRGLPVRVAVNYAVQIALGLAAAHDRGVVHRDVLGNRDIWLMDIARGLPVRFTFDPGRDASPVWSADGRHLAWQGTSATYMKDASGSGREAVLHGEPWIPDDWLPDGTGLLLHPGGPHQYDVSPDGQRFLVNTPETSTSPLNVIVNWTSAVNR